MNCWFSFFYACVSWNVIFLWYGVISALLCFQKCSFFHFVVIGGPVQGTRAASPSQGHIETNETNNHPLSQSLLGGIRSHEWTWHAFFWEVGGSRSIRSEPRHTWGEHADSTQTGPRWDSNQEPSCCANHHAAPALLCFRFYSIALFCICVLVVVLIQNIV